MLQNDLIDSNSLDRLFRLGGKTLVDQMFELFQQAASEKVTAVLEGMKAADLDTVERAAHSLKSSAGNLGAIQMLHLCTQIEHLARECKTDELPDLVDQLEPLYHASCEQLKHEIERKEIEA
jgi:HPt (histidine-containing phosphotransfer) domain-containing protein